MWFISHNISNIPEHSNNNTKTLNIPVKGEYMRQSTRA